MAELAATSKVVLGSVAFAIFWVLAVFPAVPLLPIGRTAGSLLSAMLMVLFGVITPDDAYKAIDLPILALLFATMVVSAYLERADLFSHLGRLLSWKCKGRKDLLFRICLVSAVASALFTNDTCCVVLTGFVLKLARQNNLPPRPFLLALASSANIGSAATPIGNPQNLIIATQSHISFGKFVLSLLPAMLVGVLVNACMLLLHYWKELSVAKDVEMNDPAADNMFAGEEVTSHRFSPATMAHLSSMDFDEWIGELDSFTRNPSVNGSGIAHAESTLRNRGVASATAAASADEAQEVISLGTESPAPATNSPFELTSDASIINGGSGRREEPDSSAAPRGITSWARRMTARWKTQHLWRVCVYLVTVGMLVALLMGLNMSWTALTAAMVLIVLDFKDAQPCLEKVSYSLLIFFCGMFITVAGFNRTGLPSALWEAMEPHARIDRPSGIAVLGAVVLLLSNIASNVPTVLLLGAQVASSAARISTEQETKAWLILAWVSTVAGNLTLLGSAANLIVCEQAQRMKSNGYNLSFFAHLRFGFLSTLVVTAVGLLLIRN